MTLLNQKDLSSNPPQIEPAGDRFLYQLNKGPELLYQFEELLLQKTGVSLCASVGGEGKENNSTPYVFRTGYARHFLTANASIRNQIRLKLLRCIKIDKAKHMMKIHDSHHV